MITIDIHKLIDYLPYVLMAILSIQAIIIMYKRARLDFIAKSWLQDSKKLEIYNKFINYVTTDIKTGLPKKLRFGDIPRIREEKDYESLSDEDRTLVLVVFSYLNGINDLEAFEKDMDEYLEAAEEIKQLRGF